MARAINIQGQRFGRLLVLRRVGRVAQGKAWSAGWECRCDCGGIRVAAGTDLRKGLVLSCGCWIGKTERGVAAQDGYSTYKAMLSRCTNPKDKDYVRYGGRGISVCARWIWGDAGKSGVATFLDDMGPRPTPHHSVDRIDVDGNYCPSNCRWANATEQSRNRRNNYRNGTSSKEIAEAAGVRPGTFRSRVSKGWTVEEALDARDHRRRHN